MKKIIYSLCFFFTVMVFSSCEKDLNLFPQDKYSEATFFQNAEQFRLFANNFYLSLPDRNGALGRDAASDILSSWSANTTSNGSYSPPTNSSFWSGSYSSVRKTTYLIDKAKEVPKLADQINKYVGEAHFFRALTYFNLLKDYGGVPLIDKVLDLNDTELIYGKRNSREEVVDFILKDINNAISLLPNEKEIPMNEKGRVSKGAAHALKSRIALFEGSWRKFRNQDGSSLLNDAISSAQEVINSNEYALFDRRDVLGDESYKYFFILDKIKTNSAGLTKADQKEYMLCNRYDTDIRPFEQYSAHKMPSATQKFADLFLCTDGLPIEKSPLFKGRKTVESEYENRDLRMSNLLQKPFTRFWANYPPEYNRNWSKPADGGNIYDINFGNTTQTGYFHTKFRTEIALPNGIDYPAIRYAEVLLNYAEALYEKNGNITDDQLDLSINKLRARAGLPKLTNGFASSNQLDMRNEIRRERTIELFLEGFRFDDLRRWKTAEVEMPQALKGVLWKGTQYETDPKWSEVHFTLDTDGHLIVEPTSKRKFEEKHYLFPLPTRQILLNSNLEQNPGWD